MEVGRGGWREGGVCQGRLNGQTVGGSNREVKGSRLCTARRHKADSCFTMITRRIGSFGAWASEVIPSIVTDCLNADMVGRARRQLVRACVALAPLKQHQVIIHVHNIGIDNVLIIEYLI